MSCNSSKRTYRNIGRYSNEVVLERMSERLAARPGMLATHRESVEHPFSTMKHWMGQGTCLMRGLEYVRGEFSLSALAYNLRRAINLLGIPTLLAVVHSRS